MSVVSTDESFEERSGSKDINGTNYVRVWKVETNDVNDNPAIVLSEADLPALFSEYPDDGNAILRKFDVKVFGDRLHWKVFARYTPKANEQDVVEIEDAEPNISFSFDRFTAVVDKAYNSTIGGTHTVATLIADVENQDAQETPAHDVRNSARDDFDPPVVQEDSNQLITITRRERPSQYDPNVTKLFKNTMNKEEETVAGITMGVFEGLMRNINANKKWDQDGNEYWEVTYEIEYNERTHIKRILDQGYYERDGSGNLIPIQDGGTPPQNVTEPQRLTGTGAELGESGDPVYLPYQTYFAADWGDLDLPAEK